MCLVEYSPALNRPGTTKCDASFFSSILDLKLVFGLLDCLFVLSFEFRISGQSSVAPSRAAWASRVIGVDFPLHLGAKNSSSRTAKRQGRIGAGGYDDIASFTPLLLVFPHTRTMPSCISPSLNNSDSLSHIHPRVLNPLHRQPIPLPFSYPRPPSFVFNLSRLRLSPTYDPLTQIPNPLLI